MSKSFAVINGDLSLGSGRAFQIVSGQDKLVQDLTLWIEEKIGTDPSTPTYGSTLDGGYVDGQIVPSFIGQIVSSATMMSIRNEVISLLQQYQTMQFAKMQGEVIQYSGKTTLDEAEVLEGINSVQTTSVGSTILVQCSLTTLAGTTLKLTLPVQGNS